MRIGELREKACHGQYLVRTLLAHWVLILTILCILISVQRPPLKDLASLYEKRNFVEFFFLLIGKELWYESWGWDGVSPLVRDVQFFGSQILDGFRQGFCRIQRYRLLKTENELELTIKFSDKLKIIIHIYILYWNWLVSEFALPHVGLRHPNSSERREWGQKYRFLLCAQGLFSYCMGLYFTEDPYMTCYVTILDVKKIKLWRREILHLTSKLITLSDSHSISFHSIVTLSEMSEPQDSPCRILVMASGFGSNFQALIDAISTGQLENSRIISLVTNRRNAHATVRADKAGRITPLCAVRSKVTKPRYRHSLGLLQPNQSWVLTKGRNRRTEDRWRP